MYTQFYYMQVYLCGIPSRERRGVITFPRILKNLIDTLWIFNSSTEYKSIDIATGNLYTQPWNSY